MCNNNRIKNLDMYMILPYPCLSVSVFFHPNGSLVVAGVLQQGVGECGRGVEVAFRRSYILCKEDSTPNK